MVSASCVEMSTDMKSSSPHQRYHFNLVPVAQHALGMLAARNQLEVDFHGQVGGPQLQLRKQLRDRAAGRHVTRLAVESDGKYVPPAGRDVGLVKKTVALMRHPL